jgi:hypothetical protein
MCADHVTDDWRTVQQHLYISGRRTFSHVSVRIAVELLREGAEPLEAKAACMLPAGINLTLTYNFRSVRSLRRPQLEGHHAADHTRTDPEDCHRVYGGKTTFCCKRDRIV